MIYHYNERALTRGGLRAGEMPTRDVFFVSMVARVAFLFAIDLKEVALLPISLPDDRDLKGERTGVCHI